MLTALISAKGSPGATTAALALAAVSNRGLMVECDPSGGSIECWTGVSAEPGLMRVASALRRSCEPDSVRIGARPSPPGVAVVHAPTSGTMTESALMSIGEQIPAALNGAPEMVFVDAGRWSRSQPTAGRIAGCDVVLIVCVPTVAGIAAVTSLIEAVAATTARPGLLLVGDRPYSPDEISAVTRTPVVGVLPWDSRAVNGLITDGVTKTWLRSSLARSASTIVTRLQPAATDSDERGAVA